MRRPTIRPTYCSAAMRAARAVARFADGRRLLVVGGTAGDLPFARAAGLPNNALVFDPVNGLFGLSFNPRGGPLISATLRQALAMAVDRQALATALGASNLAPRTSLVPAGRSGSAQRRPARLGGDEPGAAPR